MPIPTFVVPREDGQAESTNTNSLRPIRQPSIERHPHQSTWSSSGSSSEGSADENDDFYSASTGEYEGPRNPVPPLYRAAGPDYFMSASTGEYEGNRSTIPPPYRAARPVGDRRGSFNLFRDFSGSDVTFSLRRPDRADQQTVASVQDLLVGQVGAVQQQNANNADNQERMDTDPEPANGLDAAYSTLLASFEYMQRQSERLRAIIGDSRDRQSLEESERHLSAIRSAIESLNEVRRRPLPQGVAPTATTPDFGLRTMGEMDMRLNREALRAQTTSESAPARPQAGSPLREVITPIPTQSSHPSSIGNTAMVQGNGDRAGATSMGPPPRPAPRAVPRLRVSSDLEDRRIRRARSLQRRERSVRENYDPSQVNANTSTIASSSESRELPPFDPVISPSTALQTVSGNADARTRARPNIHHRYRSRSPDRQPNHNPVVWRRLMPTFQEPASSSLQILRDQTDETAAIFALNDQQAVNAANTLQGLYEADSLPSRPSDDAIGLGIRIGAAAPLTTQSFLNNNAQAPADSSQNINFIQAAPTSVYNLSRQTLEERLSMSGRAQYWNRVNNERARLRRLDEQLQESQHRAPLPRNVPLNAGIEQHYGMLDDLEVPPSIRSCPLISLIIPPEHQQTWRQLEQWAQENTTPEALGLIRSLRRTHYQELMRQRQQPG
jgi:hypothetical protein